METQIDVPQDSSDIWERLFEYRIKPADGSQKFFVGNSRQRMCRFCERTATSFRKDAHIIPAAFGNRLLFSLEECDDCNQRGSQVESDLASFLSLARAMSLLPARKGMPKFKPKQNAYIESRRAENRIYARIPPDDDGIRMHDDGNGNINLSVDIPKYRQINVAKAIARMAAFCLGKDYPDFGQLRDWVCGKYNAYPVHLLVLHWPNTGFNVVFCSCHKYLCEPGRNIIRCEFSYGPYLLLVPIPLDGKPLPDGLRFFAILNRCVK